MIFCLFNAALWSPAGKGLTSWPLFVMLNCVLAHLSRSDKVSFYDRTSSVVRLSSSVRILTIDLNDNSS